MKWIKTRKRLARRIKTDRLAKSYVNCSRSDRCLVAGKFKDGDKLSFVFQSKICIGGHGREMTAKPFRCLCASSPLWLLNPSNSRWLGTDGANGGGGGGLGCNTGSPNDGQKDLYLPICSITFPK